MYFLETYSATAIIMHVNT